MCQALIDIRKEGWDEGRDTVTKEIVLRMHKLTQIPLKDIAAGVNLTLEEVQAIIDEAEQGRG